MRYISTRAGAPDLNFHEAVLAGLASDGGLYLPESLPHFSPDTLRSFRGLSYAQLATNILLPFVAPCIREDELAAMCARAYGSFSHEDTAPLVQIAPNHFIAELFHGPTLAFKDFALQLLGHLMEHALSAHEKQALVLGATSGDTGSAAIAGLRGRRTMPIVILYPDGRPSDVQRKQMTTTGDDSVHALAVAGTFDDCQDLVKAMFVHPHFRDKLLAVNSINIARVLAQIVYYIYTALKLGAPDQAVSFSVPTGNFGDVYAGYLAKKMGLNLHRLMIATNANDILARCVDSGEYRMQPVAATLSPSMDIQIASNFERLLFDLMQRDGSAVASAISQLRSTGSLTLTPAQHAAFIRDFDACRVSDEETTATMQRVLSATGYLLDPHTATGVFAADALADHGVPIITLATAHPAKFPDVVRRACSIDAPVPERLQQVLNAPEHSVKLANDNAALIHYLESL